MEGAEAEDQGGEGTGEKLPEWMPNRIRNLVPTWTLQHVTTIANNYKIPVPRAGIFFGPIPCILLKSSYM